MSRKQPLRTAFLVALAILVVAAIAWRLANIRRTSPDAPVVIGVLAPFGTTAGEGIRNGAAMAVEELNRQGGILGRTVVIVEADTAFSVEQTVRGYAQLASTHGAVAVIGIAGDGAFGVMDQLATYRVPVLCTGTGADRLTAMVAEDPVKYGWFFRVMHASSELGTVTSGFAREFLHGELGFRRFAILVESSAWTESIRGAWRTTIAETPGMEIVFDDSFSSETSDFRPVLARIVAASPDYILDASSTVEATSYLKQWAAMQGPPIGAIPTGAGTRRYYDEVGDTGVSVCSVSTIPSEINQVTPRSAEWWGRYVARFGDPEYTSGYSYDAVFVLAEAIARAGSTNGDALRTALEGTDHQGVAGRWQFGPDHHPRYGPGFRTIPMIQYFEPGPRGYRIVWPKDRAQGEFTWPAWMERGGRE